MSNFYDVEKTAQELLVTLEDLGEDITFIDIDGEEVHCKLSSYTKMSTSTTNIASQDYLFTGVMSFPDRLSMETFKGNYFKKDNQPDKIYMLSATNESFVSDNVAPCAYIECNKVISIGYVTEVTEGFTQVKVLNPIYEDINCYWAETIQTQSDTSVGTSSNDIITIYVPSFYPITTKDFVSVKVFERVGTTAEVNLVDKIYNVEAVNTALIKSIDNSTYYGLSIALITEEL